jgi:hypothetical protein
MRRAPTHQNHAMTHLSTIAFNLATTAAAASDPYRLLELEASKRDRNSTQPSEVRGTEPRLRDQHPHLPLDGERLGRADTTPHWAA